MLYDVFISYTQPDRNVASYIHDTFLNNYLTCWIAPSRVNGIRTGSAYESQIVHAIENSKVFLLIYSDYCNQSDDIIQELRHRNKHHPTIILLLDYSAYRADLSYYLRGVQYIEASRNKLKPAARQLLVDVSQLLGKYTPYCNGSTEKLLFYTGTNLIKEKKYMEAIDTLRHHLDTSPNSDETRFYLALAIIGGKKIKKLNGMQVSELENILEPAASTGDAGYIRLLLAIIKQGYYQENGFKIKEPSIDKLIKGVVLQNDKTDALHAHLHEWEKSNWQQLLMCKSPTQQHHEL